MQHLSDDDSLVLPDSISKILLAVSFNGTCYGSHSECSVRVVVVPGHVAGSYLGLFLAIVF